MLLKRYQVQTIHNLSLALNRSEEVCENEKT
jgi:hypothetical protein